MKQLKDILIRDFLIDDLGSVKLLIDQTIDRCYCQYYDKQVVAFFKDYHSEEKIIERANNGYTIVTICDNVIIGTGSLIGNYVSSVYVSKENQFAGIGKKIMEVLIQKAHNDKLDKLILDSTPGAHQFYLSLGFKEIEERIQWIDEIYPLSYYVMEKVL